MPSILGLCGQDSKKFHRIVQGFLFCCGKRSCLYLNTTEADLIIFFACFDFSCPCLMFPTHSYSFPLVRGRARLLCKEVRFLSLRRSFLLHNFAVYPFR